MKNAALFLYTFVELNVIVSWIRIFISTNFTCGILTFLLIVPIDDKHAQHAAQYLLLTNVQGEQSRRASHVPEVLLWGPSLLGVNFGFCFINIIFIGCIISTCFGSVTGPTSLIQFKIWLCGTVDEKQLEDLLIQSTRHAVCDIILEYRLLTAPICEVPPHYCKGVLSPMHSAPVSPNSSTPNGSWNCSVLFFTQSAFFGYLKII